MIHGPAAVRMFFVEGQILKLDYTATGVSEISCCWLYL